MEKGHAKIVESLFKLIAFLGTLDPLKYNPPNPSLAIAALQNLYEAAQNALAAVSGARENWRTVAKDRAIGIDKIPALAAQLVAMFASLGVDEARVEQARAYLREIRGERAEPAARDNSLTPGDESEKSISAAQTSAAQVISHFRALVDFLAAQPEYELVKDTGLQTSDLAPVADEVETKHEASVTAAATLSSERSARDRLLYDNPDSICSRAALIKDFVKAKYGAGSDEFKTVNSISFAQS